MAIVAKRTGEARKPIPKGSYTGVVVGIYDIGTHEGGKYGPKHQVIITYELHKKKGICKDENDRPLLISKFYNLAFGEGATLREHAEAIIGRVFTEDEVEEGYDIEQLADMACRLTIKHYEKTKGGTGDDIGSISEIDFEEYDEPQSETDTVTYSMDPSKGFDKSVPEWIQNKVKASREWAEYHKGKKSKSNDDEDEDEDEDDTPPPKKKKATANAKPVKTKKSTARHDDDEDEDQDEDDDDIPF